MEKPGNIVKGALLVAGTTIGGGVLGLPVLTSLGGFVPSLFIYLLCWGFMAATGLLFLEVCHWLKGEGNILSMAEHTLGRWGKFTAWLVYLFLFYCLTLAYVLGTGELVVQVFPIEIPGWLGSLIFVLIFAPFIFAGTQVVGRLNMLFMVGLGLSFLFFFVMGYSHVNPEFLKERNWALSLIALPISFTSFAYQGIVPTLSQYMHHDVRKTRLAILIGSFIPFLAYVVWQWLILGIIPTYGEGGLAEALENGENAIQPLKNFLENPNTYLVGQYFAFFALTTSFFGVTLGLLDFLADGLKIEKNSQGKFILCLMIFLPPLLVSSLHPHIFLQALDYAGGFGCAILLGLFPILMVWSGRYRLNIKGEYVVWGGRLFLILLLIFVVFEILFEVRQTIIGH